MTAARAASEHPTVTGRTPRRLPGARWWHRWINIFIGVVLALWVVSGVVMLLPPSAATRSGQGTGRPVDWSAVAISPAQAVQAAFAGRGDGVVASVSLQRLRDGMAYLVRFKRAGAVLIDAATGELITIDQALAVAIAGDAVPNARAARVEKVDRSSSDDNGPTPSWHVVFDDKAGTEAWVAAATGEVRRNQRRDRVKAFLGGSLHRFAALREAPGGEMTRKGALSLASAVAMASILTGYWLTLPRRWRNRSD